MGVDGSLENAGKKSDTSLYIPRWSELVNANNMFEAEIIKGLMESHDIPVRLSYESLEAVGIPLRVTLSGRTAGISVQVADDFLGQARSLMAAEFVPVTASVRRVPYKGEFGKMKARKS